MTANEKTNNSEKVKTSSVKKDLISQILKDVPAHYHDDLSDVIKLLKSDKRSAFSRELRSVIDNFNNSVIKSDGSFSTNPNYIAYASDVLKFYSEVFDIQLNVVNQRQKIDVFLEKLKNVKSGKVNQFALVNPRSISPAEIISKIQAKWKLPESNLYADLNKIKPGRTRVQGEYLFIFNMSDECEYQGQSYLEIGDQITLMNLTEYLIATAYFKWKTGSFFDNKTTTIFDTSWGNDGIINAKFDFDRLDLYMSNLSSKLSKFGFRNIEVL